MANRFFPNVGRFYSNHVTPVQLDLAFTVTPTNGAGVSSLVGPGVANVFMHSSSPASGHADPVAGIISINLADNYNAYFGADISWQAPVTGSEIGIKDTLVAGDVYQITTLGNSTLANWVTIGLPQGLTPAVGMAFVAATTTVGGSTTGKVKIVGDVASTHVSGSACDKIIGLGNPQLELGPVGLVRPANTGAWLYFGCYLADVLTAPATGTQIYMSLMLGNSSAKTSSSGT